MDEGLFGPDSVTWRIVGHHASVVGGLRSLIIQSLHPLAMAGVAEHSDYRNRPLTRLRRTARYVAATTFGTTAQARRAAAHVRRIHRTVRGVDPITGRSYSADDAQTQVWVHTVEMHSFLVAYRVYVGSVSQEDADRYFAENVRVAELMGVPAELVPASAAAVRAYFASVRPQLCVSDVARDAIDFVLRPPLLDRELLPVQLPLRVVANAALAIVPRDLRRLAGIDRPRAIDLATIAATRPVIAAMRLPLAREGYDRAIGVGRKDRDVWATAERDERHELRAVGG